MLILVCFELVNSVFKSEILQIIRILTLYILYKVSFYYTL